MSIHNNVFMTFILLEYVDAWRTGTLMVMVHPIISPLKFWGQSALTWWCLFKNMDHLQRYFCGEIGSPKYEVVGHLDNGA